MSAALQDPRLAMHRRRKRLNVVALTLSLAAMAFGVFWLIWILVETVRLGFGGLALSVFTEMTPPPLAATGGLANAIFGSLVMVSLATISSTASTWRAAFMLRRMCVSPRMRKAFSRPSLQTSTYLGWPSTPDRSATVMGINNQRGFQLLVFCVEWRAT